MSKKGNLLFMLFFFIFFIISGYCNSGLLMSVFGTATDEQKQTPMKSLGVILLRIENDEVIEVREAKTNDRGFFKISKLKAGTYEFILDIPGKGIVTIPHPTETEITEVKNNQFKIEDGQNINLNFSIGLGEIPEIIIETKKVINQINVIFHYVEISNETASIQMLKKEASKVNTSAEPVCEVILNNVNYIENDSRNLGTTIRNGVRRNVSGKFYPIYQCSNAQINCLDGKCKLEKIKVMIGGRILIHSAKWHQDLGNYLPSEGVCLRDCTLQHERIHESDAKDYFTNNFCNQMNNLNSISCCFAVGECGPSLIAQYRSFERRFNIYMNTTSEDHAYGISDPCCHTCLN